MYKNRLFHTKNTYFQHDFILSFKTYNKAYDFPFTCNLKIDASELVLDFRPAAFVEAQ